MNTAQFVRSVKGWRGDVRLYKCTPPHDGYDYVLVSAVAVPHDGPETYIFPSDADGNRKSWTGMTGSFSGELNHEEALRLAGYTLNARNAEEE